MWAFGSFCDQFQVASRLQLKLEVNPSRETLLHFFEQVRRAFPSMTRFRRRGGGALVLDEQAAQGGLRRAVRLSANALRFAVFEPPGPDACTQFASMVLGEAPLHLSLSPLDYDWLETMFRFDLEYAGNHDELVGEVLLAEHPFVAALADVSRRIIELEPRIGVTLSDDGQTQAFLDIRGRTTIEEVQSGDYEATALSVCLTLRRYWTPIGKDDLVKAHAGLVATGAQIAESRVLSSIVQPLAAAISRKE